MIEMAENRGLFGSDSSTPGKTKTVKNPKKKQEEKVVKKTKRKNKDIEVKTGGLSISSEALKYTSVETVVLLHIKFIIKRMNAGSYRFKYPFDIIIMW